ncbi:hypothetical protein JHK85_032546 [Glycine max]|nr:hypothetical protein JHK85_032546 [Glycine max]KAG4995151.1 hypothetical protein JHK86_031978 [Glycine max]
MKIEELDDGECSRDEEEKCQRQIVSIDAKRGWLEQFLLLGVVLFPKDVPHLKKVGVGGVITLNEPYEILVQLYQAHGIDHLVEYKFMTPVAALEYKFIIAKAVLYEVIRLAPKLHESYHTLGLVYTSL